MKGVQINLKKNTEVKVLSSANVIKTAKSLLYLNSFLWYFDKKGADWIITKLLF